MTIKSKKITQKLLKEVNESILRAIEPYQDIVNPALACHILIELAASVAFDDAPDFASAANFLYQNMSAVIDAEVSERLSAYEEAKTHEKHRIEKRNEKISNRSPRTRALPKSKVSDRAPQNNDAGIIN